MHEGWYHDQHFILFTPDEADAATERYSVRSGLPGLRIIGIRGWDDFILSDTSGQLFTAPTVPLIQEYVEQLPNVPPAESLEPEPALEGRIKWYVQPLVFGGSAELGENVIWVSHYHHAELVRWWNAKYREVRGVAPVAVE